MERVIVVHPSWDHIWPWAAEHFHTLWKSRGAVDFVRLGTDDRRPISQVIANPGAVRRLVSLNAAVTPDCAMKFTALQEAVLAGSDATTIEVFKSRGVKIIRNTSEGFWGQSVSEFALGLTIGALRRIPQTHHNIHTNLADWQYEPEGGVPGHGKRGQQFGDDKRFTSGTVAGKRVRVVGAGNIGSRYASFCHALGADVAAWDPVASEPSFHRAGARRVHTLDRLVADAEIFAPMMPLLPATQGIVTAAHIYALPKGCLVVLVTRAAIVDMPALRRRVLGDELALAADVFDVEPLPLNDPLLGRHNVVHTPHNAGRTIHANQQIAEQLDAQFSDA